MSEIKTFHLPDLGEGLPDATIVEWHVDEGDRIDLDAPLVSMETAKAVIDVPSPFSGTVKKLAGRPGDVILTGSVLAQFNADPAMPQRLDSQEQSHLAEPSQPQADLLPTDQQTQVAPATVVGAVESSEQIHHDPIVSVGGVAAMPAVRAMAKKLGVTLSSVVATGVGGTVTMADVKAAAQRQSGEESASESVNEVAQGESSPIKRVHQRTVISLDGQPMRTASPQESRRGQPDPIRGALRNMARTMAQAHAQVVPTTICDDADIHSWGPDQDITVRLIRAIVAASRAVPELNAWFDAKKLTRTIHDHVDVGIAVDTEDGLFVPALRNADVLDKPGLRNAINRLRQQVQMRAMSTAEMSDYTISLSNFGMYAGCYATPVVVPPCVAIIAAGRARHQLVPVIGGIEAHRLIPLSLTFDHRAVTGGQAARFLRQLLADLALSE